MPRRWDPTYKGTACLDQKNVPKDVLGMAAAIGGRERDPLGKHNQPEA